MKKRAFERIPAELESRCFNIDNFGTVTNLSENGIFLESKNINFPLNTQFEISLQLNKESLNLPVKISRITKSNGYYDGIGLELQKQPQKYIKTVKRLRHALQNQKRPHNR